MKQTFADELNAKFAGKVVRNVHERAGDKYTAIVVEFETGDNSILFLVADSARLIYHEESPTIREHEDVFDPADCPLQPGWVPYHRCSDDLPTTHPKVLESMEEL